MPKERTDGSPQLNLRVPREHHDRVRRVVALLRTAEGFPTQLDELLAIASEPLTVSSQSGIVSRIERLEAAVFSPAKPVEPVVASRGIGAIKQSAASDSTDSDAASMGRRKGAPVTAEERARVRHLIETTHMSNPQIGKAVGLSGEMVRRIRRELAADSGASSDVAS
jgi:hypothetical protein